MGKLIGKSFDYVSEKLIWIYGIAIVFKFLKFSKYENLDKILNLFEIKEVLNLSGEILNDISLAYILITIIICSFNILISSFFSRKKGKYIGIPMNWNIDGKVFYLSCCYCVLFYFSPQLPLIVQLDIDFLSITYILASTTGYYFFVNAFYFIRSKEDAEKKNLPRMSRVARKSFGVAIVILSILVLLNIFNILSSHSIWINLVGIIPVLCVGATKYFFRDNLREKYNDLTRAEEQDVEYSYSSNYWYYLVTLLRRNNYKLFSKLIKEYSFNINAKENDGFTFICDAAARDDIDSVKYLMEQGADINLITNKGRSPLHYACAKASDDMVRLVFKNSKSLDIKELTGESIWDALLRREKIKLLCELLNLNKDSIDELKSNIMNKYPKEKAEKILRQIKDSLESTPTPPNHNP